MRSENLLEVRRDYQERLSVTNAAIDEIIDFERTQDPGHCYKDEKGQYVHANSDCPTRQGLSLMSDRLCPFVTFDDLTAWIRWIDTIDFLCYFLLDPTAAKGQTMLEGYDSRPLRHYYR